MAISSPNNAKNIIVGASPLFLSVATTGDSSLDPTAGADKAAFSSTASYTDTLNAATTKWRNVGYTNNGLQITYNPTYGSVTVDQLLDTAKLFKESMEVMIATEMTEGTLENVMAVFGQSGTDVSSSPISATNTLTTESGYSAGTVNKTKTLGLAAGALGVAPTERQLVAVGQAPTAANDAVSAERIYYARRVLSVQQSQFSLSRNNPTVFPVTFRLLPDGNTAYAGQEYGKIIDRVLVAAV